MAEIADGRGTGRKAQVDSSNRLVTKSFQLSEAHHINQQREQAFAWPAPLVAVAATNFILYLQNLHDELAIQLYQLVGGDGTAATSVLLELFEVTGTPVGGVAFTGRNQNLSSGITPSALSQRAPAITGLTAVGESLVTARVTGLSSLIVPIPAHILIPPNKAVALRATIVGATTVDVVLTGYFGNIEFE